MTTSYAYAFNDPIRFVDPDVMVKPDGIIVCGLKSEYNLNGFRSYYWDKLIKTEEGFQATRDQQIIYENRDEYPEKLGYSYEYNFK